MAACPLWPSRLCLGYTAQAKTMAVPAPKAANAICLQAHTMPTWRFSLATSATLSPEKS